MVVSLVPSVNLPVGGSLGINISWAYNTPITNGIEIPLNKSF